MAADRSMTERDKIAKSVLAYGKALVPDRFPKPDPLTLQAWSVVLGEMRVPPQVWPEAIAWWSMNSVGDRMVTPRELKDAAQHIVRDVWETDPEKRRVLEVHRAARLREREQRGELPHGTAPEVPGDTSMVAIEARSEGTESRWRELRAGIAQRARSRREQDKNNAAGDRGLFADMNKQPGDTRQEEG